MNTHITQPVNVTHAPLSYDQWFKRSSRPHTKHSVASLNDYQDYQENVERNSQSQLVELEHRNDLEVARLRQKQVLNSKRVFIETSGTSFVIESSPSPHSLQMTNQDITIIFDDIQVLSPNLLMLKLQKQAVATLRIKTQFQLNQIETMLGRKH